MRVNEILALVGSRHVGISRPLDCDVYAVRGSEGVLLIGGGAGTHTSVLLRNLKANFPGAPVRALLLTHCHMDHCGGAAEIRQLTGCKVIVPELCRCTLETSDEESIGLRVAREQGVYPPGDLPEPRLYAVAVTTGGWIYVLSGIRTARDYKSVSNAFWHWKPGHKWTLAADLPDANKSQSKRGSK